MPMPKAEYATCRYCGSSIERYGDGPWKHTNPKTEARIQQGSDHPVTRPEEKPFR